MLQPPFTNTGDEGDVLPVFSINEETTHEDLLLNLTEFVSGLQQRLHVTRTRKTPWPTNYILNAEAFLKALSKLLGRQHRAAVEETNDERKQRIQLYMDMHEKSPSYAQVANRNVKPNGTDPTAVQKPAETQHVLLLKPLAENVPVSDRLSRAAVSEIRQKLCKAVPKEDRSFNICHIRPGARKTIVAAFPSAQDAHKANIQLAKYTETLGLRIAVPKEKRPRLIVRGVPKDIEPDEFVRDLTVRNHVPGEVQFVKKFVSEKAHVRNCAFVFECGLEARERLRMGEVFIRFGRCSVTRK